MIHFVTYIDAADWRIECFILEKCNDGNDVIEALADAGCRGSQLADAAEDLTECGINIGITFSVEKKRNSILVIGLQSDKSEFVSTMRHEQHHVICHICTSRNIDIESEEAAYIAGDVGKSIYNELRKFALII